ncbi:MAG: hypothetical protein ABI051_09650 [Vicinamibacterales bacterium]
MAEPGCPAAPSSVAGLAGEGDAAIDFVEMSALLDQMQISFFTPGE